MSIETKNETFRQISLKIAREMMRARAAMDDNDEDYNILEDGEGYLESILIAMKHLADEQLKANPGNAGAYEFYNQLSHAHGCYLEDLEEERRAANANQS